jgi:arylamine N-acetyltransferase
MSALSEFMRHFEIAKNMPPQQLLDSIGRAFAKLPYENITKIIKRSEAGSAEKSRRYPEEVIRGHIDWGAGGTCFSLTSALAELVRDLGWKAEYILADRRYGLNTHCALLVWMNGKAHLLDPGFLIVNPVRIEFGGKMEVPTSFNRLVLEREENPRRISLSTIRKGSTVYRLTYKIIPVDEGEFFKAWDASFDWDMMKYPLLTCTSDSRQIYLNGTRLQISDGDSIERSEIPEDALIPGIVEKFHIRPSVVRRAVAILRDRGERFGKSANR